ncbi:metallophosphoesterase [Deinococcus cellulosilyticus]|uniref:Putative metallophosphoesterase n=1 Tax=Deinococcus cellulosilyticus (strain DSM 18568 / NBRC 106333 / KACC 11606 / 5516J-15) TaxID=1223518 RepID=A0A511N883_DEIC1|nr:metallophosphoesterase [Deinococcus cellulosilyticus]GEM49043.1 putative metallophosphoesterase [Deinococcus cellulosilyticus NBRC 106333 = KACC 11606]
MKVTRRQFFQRMGLAAASVVGLGGYSFAEARQFEVNEHTLPVKGLQSAVRVAHLSDLHYSALVSLTQIESWIKATMQRRPDLILITGDFISNSEDYAGIHDLGRVLSQLRAPLGVYGVWGNHDYYLPPERLIEFEQVLRQAGIRLLNNAAVQLRPDLQLAGLDDLVEGLPSLEAALQNLKQDIGVLLMSHNPDVLPQVPEWVDLTLCGHTHGGQVRLPLVGAIHIPSRFGERFAQGVVHAPARGFVSRGLGVTGVPFRFLCDAELVMLNLQPV